MMTSKPLSKHPLYLKHTIATVLTVMTISAVIYTGYHIGQLLKGISITEVLETLSRYALYILLTAMAVAIYSLIHMHFYEKLFKEKPIKSCPSWIQNTGERPSCTIMNIEFADKSIKWNVYADDFDWSLNTDNPITSYLPKHSIFRKKLN